MERIEDWPLGVELLDEGQECSGVTGGTAWLGEIGGLSSNQFKFSKLHENPSLSHGDGPTLSVNVCPFGVADRPVMGDSDAFDDLSVAWFNPGFPFRLCRTKIPQSAVFGSFSSNASMRAL